jgi:hypothetical protein
MKSATPPPLATWLLMLLAGGRLSANPPRDTRQAITAQVFEVWGIIAMHFESFVINFGIPLIVPTGEGVRPQCQAAQQNANCTRVTYSAQDYDFVVRRRRRRLKVIKNRLGGRQRC